jgi:site-specific recombinase XerD
MAYLGLRVDEAMNFDWNTAFKKNKKLIGFKVVGKGNKERLVYNVFYNDYITLKASLIRNKEIEHIDYDITRFGIR